MIENKKAKWLGHVARKSYLCARFYEQRIVKTKNRIVKCQRFVRLPEREQ